MRMFTLYDGKLLLITYSHSKGPHCTLSNKGQLFNTESMAVKMATKLYQAYNIYMQNILDGENF